MPSDAVTLQVPDAPAFAVTLPFFTVTLVFPSTFHVSFLFVAFAGTTVAFSVMAFPAATFSGPFNIISVMGCVTVTLQDALLLKPSLDTALITALPGPTAVTIPFSTCATLLLLLVQTTSALAASILFPSAPVTSRCCIRFSIPSVSNVCGFNFTPAFINAIFLMKDFSITANV